MSWQRVTLLLLVWVQVVGFTGPFLRAGSAERRRNAIVRAVEKARPAVVNIHSERTASQRSLEEVFTTAPSQNRANGMGTGILVDPRGYIVTNYHVVEDVQLLRVRLSDGSAYVGRLLVGEKKHDLAILKIDPTRSLPVITIGTSADLMVGETVIAIGNAYGYEHSVTVGVISALHRDVSLNREVSYRSLIQTDASINPGNSGGPLLNIDGELIGVNVAIRAGAQGISFALPVDHVVQVAGELLASRRRPEIELGLTLRNVVEEGPEPRRWLIVERVENGTPGARAGLRPGDRVIQVAQKPVDHVLDWERALLERRAGEEIAVRVRRDRAEIEVRLPLLPPADPRVEQLAWQILGCRMAPVASEVVRRQAPQLDGGMYITEVASTGPAGQAGLRAGDILVGLHDWAIVNYDNLHYVLTLPDLVRLNPLRYYVLRDGSVKEGKLHLVRSRTGAE